MPNGENNNCPGVIMMLIHPQLDGTLEEFQVVLQSPMLPANDGLHTTSNVIHAMKKQFLFTIIDELHGLATTKQGVG